MNTSVLKPRSGRADIHVAPERASAPARLTPEFVVTDQRWRGEPVGTSFRRLAAELDARGARLLGLMLYGGTAVRPETEEAMRDALGPAEWPITWIEDSSREGAESPRFQAYAVSAREVKRIRVGDRVVASVFEDGTARHCLLGGLGPMSAQFEPAAQARQTLYNLESALALADFTLGDVVRTWFYNDDILSWYGDFNRVRSAHYARTRFRTGSLPASTGIGARNLFGAALTLAAWAMQPLDATAHACEVASPLQCPAPAYGSSFSRAMELVSGGARRLFVSGTASIWPDGRTAWIGDAPRQIELTMDVVAALLKARGMDASHVTRATAYFQKAKFKPHFDAWCERHELRRMPVVSIEADVCRDDLLFEIELDATLPRVAGRGEPAAFEI